jgi:hypothetical protein
MVEGGAGVGTIRNVVDRERERVMDDRDTFDPFAPGSNLKEDFDGTVREVVFEKSENNDNYNAHLYVRADDGDEVESFLSLGRDWTSYDGGRSVEHPRGNRTKFNAQTTYSEFVTFAMGGFDGDKEDPTARPADLGRGLGAAETMRARNRQLDNRGPQFADLWQGLRFHFDIVKRQGRQRKVNVDEQGRRSDEWVDIVQERMMPVRFLGTATGRVTPAAAPPAPTTPTLTPTLPVGTAQGAAVHPALASLDALDQQKVVVLARTHDFGGFVDGVMGLQTVNGDSMLNVPSLIQALSDEAFYTTIKGL